MLYDRGAEPLPRICLVVPPAGAVVTMVWGLLILTMAGASQPPASSNESEFSQHLTTVRSQLANPALDLGRREVIAQDMAGTLDRAAQAASDPNVRRKRWDEAIQLLDQFTRENPEAGMARTLRFQASVFRWAQAQTWMRPLAFDPSNAKHRERAIALLDDATQRLKSIAAPGDHTTLGENIRFRRARSWPTAPSLIPRARRAGNSSGPSARSAGTARQGGRPDRLLGTRCAAELLFHGGHLDEARRALDAALQAKPAPPEDQVLSVRVQLLDAAGQFDEALRAVEDSKLDPGGKGLWRVRIRLAQARPRPGRPRTCPDP